MCVPAAPMGHVQHMCQNRQIYIYKICIYYFFSMQFLVVNPLCWKVNYLKEVCYSSGKPTIYLLLQPMSLFILSIFKTIDKSNQRFETQSPKSKLFLFFPTKTPNVFVIDMFGNLENFSQNIWRMRFSWGPVGVSQSKRGNLKNNLPKIGKSQLRFKINLYN